MSECLNLKFVSKHFCLSLYDFTDALSDSNSYFHHILEASKILLIISKEELTLSGNVVKYKVVK